MRITNYKGDVVQVDIDEDLVFAGQEKSLVYPDGSTHTSMEFVELVDDGSGNIRLWDNKDGQVPQGWYMSLRPLGGDWMKADWPDWLSRKDGQGRARPRRVFRLAFIDESVLKTKPGCKWSVDYYQEHKRLETWTVRRLFPGLYFIRSREVTQL